MPLPKPSLSAGNVSLNADRETHRVHHDEPCCDEMRQSRFVISPELTSRIIIAAHDPSVDVFERERVMSIIQTDRFLDQRDALWARTDLGETTMTTTLENATDMPAFDVIDTAAPATSHSPSPQPSPWERVLALHQGQYPIDFPPDIGAMPQASFTDWFLPPDADATAPFSARPQAEIANFSPVYEAHFPPVAPQLGQYWPIQPSCNAYFTAEQQAHLCFTSGLDALLASDVFSPPDADVSSPAAVRQTIPTPDKRVVPTKARNKTISSSPIATAGRKSNQKPKPTGKVSNEIPGEEPVMNCGNMVKKRPYRYDQDRKETANTRLLVACIPCRLAKVRVRVSDFTYPTQPFDTCIVPSKHGRPSCSMSEVCQSQAKNSFHRMFETQDN